ncbi:MAG TPA: tyrosine-type recombinase/integrase [Solirubrobacteraceae bacterium]
MSKRKTWTGRIYVGRDDKGRQQFYWVGRFATKRERDQAVALARVKRSWEAAAPASCGEWVDRYLTRYRRLVAAGELKWSSLDTTQSAIKAFRRDFADRPLDSITPVEAEDWAMTVPPSAVAQAVAVFNYAVRMRAAAHNPFLGLGGKRSRGRRDLAPPTVEELETLREACEALGPYARQMRDLLDFAGLTLTRPGELFELRYSDVDLRANRIVVSRRLYRAQVDTPKSNRAKTIALPPPARDILLGQPTRGREDGLVFVGKTGTRLNASLLSLYWAVVRARAGLDESFDFYRASKHWGVHRLYTLGLSQRAIAAQAGWRESAVEALLNVYGHKDLVPLIEVDALYARERDAISDAETPDRQQPHGI